MIYNIEYKFSNANFIFAIFETNDGKDFFLPLEKSSDDIWTAQIDLAPGIYYYQLIIDNTIKLPHPSAPMLLLNEKQEVVSCVILTEDLFFLTYEFEPSIMIYDYRICCKLDGRTTEKKVFKKTDKYVSVEIELKNIIGFHDVSIVWQKPDRSFFYQTKCPVWNFNEKDQSPVIQEHSIDISGEHISPGRWNFLLFIDEVFILSDEFFIENTFCYYAPYSIMNF
ncbi:hypothetical protein [Caldicellulosiruptor morganii]|uniref:Uncharacterized protein n=1 Tax=Caldicellulosiruptor morganii TaxID=1387555 RepID=A0ABY7BPK5_9FIRM|nr:hypothetical protein [Caldicellulosiruptor morganii]WAM33705.1 hypothetical protein OTK00_002237 [Caldicellulosiruptor morganii]